MIASVLCRVTAIVAFAGWTANDDIHAPALANISPSHGLPGTQVRLEGNYFRLQPAMDDMDPFACRMMGSVLFGSSVTAASQYTDTDDHGRRAIGSTRPCSGFGDRRRPDLERNRFRGRVAIAAHMDNATPDSSARMRVNERRGHPPDLPDTLGAALRPNTT